MLVAADAEGYVRLLKKNGGCPLPKGDLTLLAKLACIRAREIGVHLDDQCKAFDARLKQNKVRRKNGSDGGHQSGTGGLGPRGVLAAPARVADFAKEVEGMALDDEEGEALGLDPDEAKISRAVKR